MFGNNSIIGKGFFNKSTEAREGKLLVTSMFMTLQGEGPYRGEPAFFIRLAKCNLACSFCFPTYKKISTVNRGMVAIGDLVKGDTLYTLDDNLQITTTTVKKTMRREVEQEDLVTVHYVTDEGKEASIICTKEHPFHVKGHPSKEDYIAAIDLEEGDVVYSVSGNTRTSHSMKNNNPMHKSEEFIRKLCDFAYNGATILAVEELNKRQYARVRFTCDPEEGKAEVANVECSPYNHYLIDGLHVHNCDTYFEDGQWLSVEEIADRIDAEIIKFFNKDSAKLVEKISLPGVDYEVSRIGDVASYSSHSSHENVLDPEAVPEWAKIRLNPRYMPDAPKGNLKHDPSILRRGMVLVITGGEPTLQNNLLELLSWGERDFEKTQIESNGIAVSNNIVPASTTVVVSPKCREELTDVEVEIPNVLFSIFGLDVTWGKKAIIEKQMKAVTYLKPSPKMLERADCLKFVMEAPTKIYESDILDFNVEHSPYCSIPDWAHKWAKETGKPVFISPMNIYREEPQKAKDLRARKTNTTIEDRSMYDEVVSFWEEGLLDMPANQRNHEWAAKYAIQHGFIFNVQIHLLASVA